MDIENLIIIEGGAYQDVKKALRQWVEIYSDELEYSGELPKDFSFKLSKISRGKHSITVNEQVDNETFFYLVNYLKYPEEIEYKIDIKGYTIGKEYNEFKNKQILVYISDNDSDYNNVCVVDSDNLNYRIDFGRKIERMTEFIEYRKPNNFDTLSSEIVRISINDIFKDKERLNIKRIERQFRVITFAFSILLVINSLYLLITSNDRIFSILTLSLGIGITFWFLFGSQMLRVEKFYYKCLAVAVFFLIYNNLIEYITQHNSIMTKLAGLYPFCFIIVQIPVRKVYVKIFKREPKLDRSGKFADMIYTMILMLSIAVLPFIIIDAMK